MRPDSTARVVVTGARGFIGSHLVRRLRRDGRDVLAVVRTERPVRGPADGVEYAVRDLERVGSLADLLRSGDVVVHLAARVHMIRDAGTEATERYRLANVSVTEMLAHSVVASGAQRLVLLSSAKVFGEGRGQPYAWNDLPAPDDAYARSKLDAERFVQTLGDQAGFEWTIIRPPFVYGPGGKGNFPRLIALARIARIVPLPLASIHNLRSIVYVGNLVDAIVRLGLEPRGAGRIVLPTDERDVSTPELLRAIATATSSRARLFACPPSLLRAAARLLGRSAEIERLTESLRLDSRYLREELDWIPPFSLETALQHTVARLAEDNAVDA